MQNNQNYVISDVYVNLVDKGYDRLTRSFEYIHTIDTGNGHQGVMLTDAIFIDDTAS